MEHEPHRPNYNELKKTHEEADRQQQEAERQHPDAEDGQEAADRLVDLANQAGGEDNITAIVVRHTAKPAGALARMGRWLKGPEVQS